MKTFTGSGFLTSPRSRRKRQHSEDMAADEDADVFEITDFTTASDWERFIARLEEVLHEWKLVNHSSFPPAPRGSFNKDKWLEKSENLQFSDFQFIITYKYLQRDDVNTKSTELRSSPDDEEEKEKEEALPTVMADLMSLDNDFPSRCHCLCRWFGLQEFLVITPAHQSLAIDNESRVKILLSSVSIALNNAGSPIPVFVQIQQNWRRIFGGMSVLPGATIDFDVIHLNKVPTQYNHLAGLLDVFKAKLATQISPRPTVTVAVRFTYILTDWVNSPWPQEPPDLSSPMEDEVGCSDFGTLPFGACEDPISEMQMACTWQSLSEDMIVENQNYSDLDPLQAPHWSVRIIMTEDPNCLLGKYVGEFLKNFHRTETMQELLHNVLSREEEADQTGDISIALQKLTEPKVSYNIPSLSSVVTKASSRLAVKQGQAPVSMEILNSILFYLFPDAKDPEEKETDKASDLEEKDKDATDNKYSKILEELPKQLKSAPDDSLVNKLAICLTIINMNHGGLRGLSQLWQEFVLEMRYRWENKYLISGVDPGAPNLGACVLYQKLQMLNCCIERKIKREQLYKGYTGEGNSSNSSKGNTGEGGSSNSSVKPEDETDDCNVTDSELKDLHDSKESQNVLKASSSKSSQLGEERESSLRGTNKSAASSKNRKSDEIPAKVPHLDSSSDDEEEFYECEEEHMETEESTEGEVSSPKEEKQLENMGESMDTTSLTSESSYKDTVTHKPEGRMTPCGQLKLISNDEQMYIPITQEPSPMTEDMLEEHAEILARLGTSSEGAQLRARMQSACLVSDMESFKAANPGCVLEDFVRWYSPRDWVEEETEVDGKTETKGHLSARMQIPGNVWAEVWQSARPVPARRQKRLFDDTKEAEKVLHFLSSMRPSDLILHLMPALVHSCICSIIQNEDSDIPKLKDLIEQLVSKASKVTRSPQQEIKRYEELLRSISLSETLIARARSLKGKFSKDLLDKPTADGAEDLDRFISELLHLPEVTVRGGPTGPAGSIIHKLFVAAQKELHMVVDDEDEEDDSRTSAIPDFPRPSAREYILRTAAPRPAPYSKTLPHKMFCSIMEGHEFRLAGAFSSDTVFQ